jgi:hypothetical protein
MKYEVGGMMESQVRENRLVLMMRRAKMLQRMAASFYGG